MVSPGRFRPRGLVVGHLSSEVSTDQRQGRVWGPNLRRFVVPGRGTTHTSLAPIRANVLATSTLAYRLSLGLVPNASPKQVKV